MTARVCFRSDDGFTLTETVVGMLLFLIAIAVIWALGMRTEKGFRLSGGAASAAVQAERADRRIRDAVARIAVPFWVPSPALSPTRGGMEIPYADGARDKTLSFGFADGEVSVNVADERPFAFAADEFEITPLTVEGAGTVGIVASYVVGGKKRETRALFGAYSLIGEAK